MSRRANRKREEPVSEEELMRRHDRFMAVVGGLRLLVQTAIIGLFAWLSVHSMFYLPIQAAHGETTTITVAQTWLANVNASVYLAWGAAAAAGSYGWLERRKRLRERKERDERITQLEERLDSNRLSSGLTPGGDIQPGKRSKPPKPA